MRQYRGDKGRLQWNFRDKKSPANSQQCSKRGTVAYPCHQEYLVCLVCCMVSITWHTRNTWEYMGKKGGIGK